VQGFPNGQALPALANGLQIFAGSVPLYKNGVLVGAIGISGDGIDQDDIIASGGSVGYEAPAAIRSDQFMVRGVRMPFVKFPRHPNL
ncbi:MAG TPA: heme-binding protein, partial [Blastocatellia bacterium]|nr:heme-binding protein [Blastocatellia bacterium]